MEFVLLLALPAAAPSSLSPLDVEWMDETAANTIAHLTALERKPAYGRADMERLSSAN